MIAVLELEHLLCRAAQIPSNNQWIDRNGIDDGEQASLSVSNKMEPVVFFCALAGQIVSETLQARINTAAPNTTHQWPALDLQHVDWNTATRRWSRTLIAT